MGACVLCGKSAGLFYSLHKNCYKQFQSSSDPIVQLLTKKLGSEAADELARQSQAIVQQLDFVEEAQQRALVRALEAYAKSNFTHENYAMDASIAWVKFLEHLDINQKLFLNPSFMVEQQNLPALALLHARELPACNCNSVQFPLELPADETLWWRFADVRLDQLQPQVPKQSWSIALHILESCLPNKSKQALEHRELGAGTLWLTSRGLYFEKEQEVMPIAYQEIVTLTPEFDGVTLQSKQLQTRPQTIRCQEGKLLYQFLRYAQSVGN